jgi:cytochrome oxidase Cu insertion factor (SCO1/SenC/PrrC family)
MRSFFISLVGSVVGVAVWGGVPGCVDRRDRPASLPVKEALATAEKRVHLVDLDGQPFDLWNADQSKVTVVVFTRSDCPISNRYAPEIHALYDRFHSRGVEFYLIYVDPHEEADAIRAHLKEYDYPCAGVRDPQHRLVTLTGATVTPEAAVFAADRKMTYRGRIDDRNADFGKSAPEAAKHDLADAIEATLTGRLVAEPVTKAVGCYIGDLE